MGKFEQGPSSHNLTTLPPSPEDLALLTMDKKGINQFLQIEDSLENPAAGLEKRDDFQAAADGYVQAGEAYSGQGFFIKAAQLKARAAGLYVKRGNEVATEIELTDAIYLDRMANNMANMAVTLQNHAQDVPLRANYPNLFMSHSYRRGKADYNHLSDSYVMFLMTNAHYSLLLRLNSSEEIYQQGRQDLYNVYSNIAREYENLRRSGLFSWDTDGKRIVLDEGYLINRETPPRALN